MTDRTPKTERGRRTMRRLLDAAAAEFGERGYHDAAITSITQRAGVALGSFYTYFEGKEALFRALVRDMSHAVRYHIAHELRGVTDRLTAERRGLEAYIGFVRRHKALYRIIEESQFVAEDVYREHYRVFIEAYRDGLRAASGRGEISEGQDEVRAWALVGMSVFLGMRYGVWGEDMSPAEVAEAAGALIAHGLAPRRGAA
ncbi:TetR family transcriptional regulator [Sphingomonas oleivorans]|uniref:TetR family transcriptional regulator n=1 Tax=Sphingomonas oleivorans TaxID=1735121 RepID=A0A2T5FW32_9SPHN|nr:TetR/AcrR family transcriptional regulator [Sphingomonas oleivorans]PTQ09996.1 TetR family transcriptional regulator [Sphingomonas oleivorans]